MTDVAVLSSLTRTRLRTTAVFPSQLDDDVVTSPYNSVLALRELNEHCDCVLPIHNQALVDICGRIQVRCATWHRALDCAHGTTHPPTPRTGIK